MEQDGVNCTFNNFLEINWLLLSKIDSSNSYILRQIYMYIICILYFVPGFSFSIENFLIFLSFVSIVEIATISIYSRTEAINISFLGVRAA